MMRVFLRPLFVAGYPKAYWYLLLGTLINGIAMFVLPFESLYLVGSRHLPVEQASAIMAVYGVGSCLSALIGGSLSDRIGRRPTIISGLLCLSMTTFGLAAATSTWLIAVLTFFLGFWMSWYRPASSAAVNDLVPLERQARANGLLYWVYNIGAAISPLLASVIVLHTSYTVLFCADGLGTLLFCVLIAVGLSETRPVIATSVQHHQKPQKQISKKGSIFPDSRFLLFTGLSFLLTSIYFQYLSTLPADMQIHGLSAAQYGEALAVNGLVVAVLGLPLAHLLDRFAPFRALAASALFLGLGFGLTALADHLFSLPVYVGSIVVWTMGEIIFVPVSATLVALLSPPTRRGLYQGIARTSWGLSACAGPLIGGIVLQQWGACLWIGCAVLGCILACSFFMLEQKREPLSNDEKNVLFLSEKPDLTEVVSDMDQRENADQRQTEPREKDRKR
jgi:MFS family permease